MLKTIAFIVRRAATLRADFRDHYEDHHVPLARPHLAGVHTYVRNHIHPGASFDASGEAVEPGFDCVTEFWYRDRAALDALVAHLASAAAAAIREDELSFMDKSANTYCAAEETLVRGPERGVDLGATIKVLALAKRPARRGREDFLTHYDAEVLPALVSGPTPPVRCTQNHTLGIAGGEPPYDCVTELWYAEAGGIPASLARIAPDAARWHPLRVIECETEMAARA